MQIGNNTLLDMKSNQTEPKLKPKPKAKVVGFCDIHVRSKRKVEFHRA